MREADKRLSTPIQVILLLRHLHALLPVRAAMIGGVDLVAVGQGALDGVGVPLAAFV